MTGSVRLAPLLPLLVLALALGSCAGGDTDAGAVLETRFDDPEALPIVLPAGDPAAGRVAFLELGCNDCHRVVDDPDFQSQISSTAPALDPVALRAQGYGAVASSIIAPGHRSATGVELLEGEAMPLVNERLTVAQWIDLVHYLVASADGTPRLAE